jgi:hypothetical protein
MDGGYMKKLLVIGLCVMLAGIFMGNTHIQAQEFQILNYVDHGEVFSPDTIRYVDGNSISLTRIEIRGTWSDTTAPNALEALTWFGDTGDDNPLAALDWASVVIDTSWTDNGDGTFSASDNIRKRYRSGAWDATPVTTGWMAEDVVYTIEVQSVIGGTPTTLETFVFDIAGTKDFDYVEYRVNYSGKRTGTQLTSGNAYVRFRFSNEAPRTFILPTGTDSLRLNWQNAAGTFYTMDYPVTFIPATEVGLNVTITPEAYPPAGYFSAGDTVDVQVVLTNDGGTELNWDESATNGLDRIYYYLSGPKQDYERIHYAVRVISSGVLQTDAATGLPFTNPLKLVLPDTLPGDVGTYSIMIRVRRYFGGTTYFAQLEDIQVGTDMVTDIIVGNCETCHNEQSTFPDMPILFNHGYARWPQCLVCHTEHTPGMRRPFSLIVHEKTMHKTLFTGVKGDCALCHINQSNNQFTSDAGMVCTACHNPTPYFPSDHAANVPLFAESGMSCATSNCHQFGGLGVFKTISETHAGLPSKYVGGTLTASSTATAPMLDGVIDAAWDAATSITTLRGFGAMGRRA